MSLSRAPWLVAFVISCAAHGSLLLWLFPTDNPEAEAGSGAGSTIQGSVDAIAGISFPIEAVAPGEPVDVVAASIAPALSPSAAVVAEPVMPVMAAATVAAEAEAVEPAEVQAPRIEASDVQVSRIEAPVAEAETLATAASPVEAVPAVDPVDTIPSASTVSAAVPHETITVASAVETQPVAPATPVMVPAKPPELVPGEPVEPQPRVERKPRKPDVPAKRDNRQQAKPALRGSGGVNSQKGAATADSSATRQDQGSGQSRRPGEGAASWTSYEGAVAAKLRRALRYPSNLARRDISGVARLGFSIDADGNVGAIVLKQSSGDDRLDEAALAAVRRAAPFPPLPPEAGRSRSIDVPLRFNVR